MVRDKVVISNRIVICSRCGGTGTLVYNVDKNLSRTICPYCNGSGISSRTKHNYHINETTDKDTSNDTIR